MSIEDQPPPQTNATTPIWKMVIADMQQRDHVGRERYGTPLQAWNGRDALVDAYQESLDLAVYLRQAIAERESAAHEIARLREALALETEALSGAAEDAKEQEAEADRWRERAETFERRMKAAAAWMRESKEERLTARDNPSNRDNSRKRWGHEQAALAYGYAADMIENALTSDGEP